jgi:GNAT superfamily N-acetyltransferase
MISPQLREFIREDYVISTDPSRLDLNWIHNYLTNDAWWARGIPYQIFKKSVENALCFGVYHQEKQVGFARVISDFATFAYIGDVFIAQIYRRQGLGKWLLKTILNFPELQNLRRWMLMTADAHGLYESQGFIPLQHPENVMEIIGKKL